MTTVAVDVTPLLTMRTGIGRSVEEMLAAVAAHRDGPALSPYALGARSRRLAHLAPEATRFVPLPTRPLLTAWSHLDLPRLDRWIGPADVVHATNFVVPPSRSPRLVTVHDCSFLLHPETVDPVVATFGPVLRRALRDGAHVHTSTEQVADEVESLLAPGLRDQGRLHVVPFGVPRLGTTTAPVPATVGDRLRGRPFVLGLGRLEPRKDTVTLVRAFGLLAQGLPDLHLVLAGPDGRARRDVDEAVVDLPSGTRDRVVMAGPVDEAGRTALLRDASVLAYPSIYEGFGFPVLEAMTLGTPVVATDLPVVREVAGADAVLVPVGAPDALSDALSRVLTCDRDREDLVSRARARSSLYTWQRTGAGLVRAYRAVSGH